MNLRLTFLECVLFGFIYLIVVERIPAGEKKSYNRALERGVVFE